MKFSNLILSILLLISQFCGCGGGSRGTGDLTINGKALQSDGTPLGSATITFSATGDSAVTASDGSFVIQTEAVSGSAEFVIDSNGTTFVSSGGELSGNVAEIAVEIEVEFGPMPKASQKVTVIKRRESKNDNESDDDQDNSNSGGKGSGNKDDSDDNGSSNGGGKNDNKGGGKGNNDNGKGNGGGSEQNDDGEEESDEDGNDDDNNSGGVERLKERGSISALSQTTITVNGNTFVVDANTRFDKAESLADFSVGDEVEVEGELRDGVYYAERIRFR